MKKDKNIYLGNKEKIKKPHATLFFHDKKGREIVRLEDNGDIFVHKNKIENDKQVVDGLREFLSSYGMYKWKRKK